MKTENERTLAYAKAAYEPYKMRAFRICGIDIIVTCVFMVATIFVLENYDFSIRNCLFMIVFLLAPFSFCLWAIAMNYGILIMAYIERKNYWYKKKKVKVSVLKKEIEFNSKTGRLMPTLFAERYRVDSYILKCYSEEGILLRFRGTLSGKQWQLLHEKIIEEREPVNVVITYGKLTHIVIKYDGQDELWQHLNRRGYCK